MRKESEEDDFVFVDKQEIPSNKQLVFAADRDNPRKRSYSHNPQPRPKLLDEKKIKKKIKKPNSLGLKLQEWGVNTKFTKFYTFLTPYESVHIKHHSPFLYIYQRKYTFDITYVGVQKHFMELAKKSSRTHFKKNKIYMKKYFSEIIWLTYRSEFSPILEMKNDKEIENELKVQYNSHTTDAGWGCMLRVGQMLLANGIKKHVFRDPPFSFDLLKNKHHTKSYYDLLNLFNDNVKGKREYAFSIQNICEISPKFGIYPGHWFGPASMSMILENINEKYHPIPNLEIVSFPDGVIFKQKILEKLNIISNNTPEDSTNFSTNRSIIVLVANRLGLNNINEEYFASLRRIMTSPFCIGFAGARGNSALYFVGYQEPSQLLFLDPHYVQKTIKTQKDLFAKYKTYHFKKPRKMDFKRLNTTICIGFYLRDMEEYERFCVACEMEQREEDTIMQIREEPPKVIEDIESYDASDGFEEIRSISFIE